jgi:hypothetical protein
MEITSSSKGHESSAPADAAAARSTALAGRQAVSLPTTLLSDVDSRNGNKATRSLGLDVTVVGVHSAASGAVAAYGKGTTVYVRDSSGLTAIKFGDSVKELAAALHVGSAVRIQGSFVINNVVWKELMAEKLPFSNFGLVACWLEFDTTQAVRGLWAVAPSELAALDTTGELATLAEVEQFMRSCEAPAGRDVFYQGLDPVKLLGVKHSMYTTVKGTEMEKYTLQVAGGRFRINVVSSKPRRPGAHQSPFVAIKPGSYVGVHCVRMQVLNRAITCWLDDPSALVVLDGYEPSEDEPMAEGALVDLSACHYESRAADYVARLKPPLNQKESYRTTAAVMKEEPRFPRSGLVRGICTTPGHERMNLSDNKRCGCPEDTRVPMYSVKLLLQACDGAGRPGAGVWSVGVEPQVLEGVFNMSAAEFAKRCEAHPDYEKQEFARLVVHHVVSVQGYVHTTSDGKYNNHTCEGLSTTGVRVQLPPSSTVRGPPPSAKRSQPAPQRPGASA